MEYNLTIRYLPGSENVVADALSRPDGVIKDPLLAGKVIPASFPEVIENPLHTTQMIASATPAPSYARTIRPRGAPLTTYLCRRAGCRISIPTGATYCDMHGCHTWPGHACNEYEEKTGIPCQCALAKRGRKE